MTLNCTTNSARRLNTIAASADALKFRFAELVESTKALDQERAFPKVKFAYENVPGFTAEFLGVKLRFEMRVHASEQTEVRGIVSCIQETPLRVNEKPFLLDTFSFNSDGVTDIDTSTAASMTTDWCSGPVVARCLELALTRDPAA